jgi:hypothetical protein
MTAFVGRISVKTFTPVSPLGDALRQKDSSFVVPSGLRVARYGGRSKAGLRSLYGGAGITEKESRFSNWVHERSIGAGW